MTGYLSRKKKAPERMLVIADKENLFFASNVFQCVKNNNPIMRAKPIVVDNRAVFELDKTSKT